MQTLSHSQARQPLTLIRVGHSAYKGANSMRLCFSKSQAVRVLRNRGVKRDEARSAVAKALKDQGATVYGEHSQVVEIANEAPSIEKGYYIHSYLELRGLWASASEL